MVRKQSDRDRRCCAMDQTSLPVGAAPRQQLSPLPRARIVLWALTFVYVLNFLDRSLLAILAKPIQDDLHVTDGQLGLIGGLYFAFFYCFIAIPVGWFADRTSRVRVLSIACAPLERRDILLRLGRQLSATRPRADAGRGWRSRRCAAVLRADHRLFSARPPRHRLRHLQSRARRSALRWASHSARPSPPRSIGAKRSLRSAWSA